jgi:signal transduction histidine kinase
LLVGVMAFTFTGLIFLQVKYVSTILKSANEQFDTTVRHCLEQVSLYVEREETREYMTNYFPYFRYKNAPDRITISQQIATESNGIYQIQNQTKSEIVQKADLNRLGSNDLRNQPTKDALIREMEEQQKSWRNRYQHTALLFEDAIYEFQNEAYLKPLNARINFENLDNYLNIELASNGLDIPYTFLIVNRDGRVIYQNKAFNNQPKTDELFTQVLFPADPEIRRNYLKIYFPTKQDYLTSSISFLVPSALFSFILLLTFTFTIYTIFRQKKLSEMKNDFVNNMTHELKTPVSTISLAAQMLKDTTIVKNTEVYKHIESVINDETKRLGFLVEKVLQISLFEKQKAALKLKEIDANDLLVSIVNTFALKVEKFGGTIDIDLEAEDSLINADEMHLTNVLFNLMDNALKYRREDFPLQLMARTKSDNNKLYISIEDNGRGIKKEHLKKIFERFYRVPTGNVHDVKGFGLGLAYVRKIVEEHGGTIRAEQEEKFTGTKFIITLPLFKN